MPAASSKREASGSEAQRQRSGSRTLWRMPDAAMPRAQVSQQGVELEPDDLALMALPVWFREKSKNLDCMSW